MRDNRVPAHECGRTGVKLRQLTKKKKKRRRRRRQQDEFREERIRGEENK